MATNRQTDFIRLRSKGIKREPAKQGFRVGAGSFTPARKGGFYSPAE